MASDQRPFTLMGKHITTPSPPVKKTSYRTKAYSSEVDETLFGTPNRFNQQMETKRITNDQQWDPPWATSPTKKGAPLLWTPFVYEDIEDTIQHGKRANSQNWSKPTTPRSARPSSKYRMRSHTPTYVDETLFGPKPEEPTFKAPWEVNSNSNNSKHLLWSPVMRNESPTSPRSNSSYERPGSRLGEYDDPYIPPTPRDRTGSANIKTPVIRQRAGSSLKTMLGSSPPPSTVKLKLDFRDKNEKDDLIERALRLAKQAQEASLKEASSTPRRTAWNRPVSSTESSPRISTRLKTHLTDEVSDSDVLSATGVRVPFSARSDRPNSARTRTKSSPRPHTSREVIEKRSWKP